ncbi:hypothetical protein HDU83_003132 [Entophlyctis luteolus]|nr:hypothetical protein HDU83_003132 [Entophlyctis luteolus]
MKFVFVLVATACNAYAASLVQISGFSPNPTDIQAYAYVPASVKPNPALLIGLHCCGCNAAYASSFYTPSADQYGFIGVFPQTVRSGQCWDVGTNAAHTRDGASDPTAIASITKYAISKYNIDPSRVYVSGLSSGAMMTNVMAALYPDLYQAAAAFMGVPFNCWQSTASPSATEAATWASYVTNAFPGYTGNRPKMQLWHGNQDTTLNFKNLAEEVKQWTTVLDATNQLASTEVQTGWTRTQYANPAGTVLVETYVIAGVGHALPLAGMVSPYMLNFMPGLTSATNVGKTTTASTHAATTIVKTTAIQTTGSVSGTCSAIYGQCGGQGWTGPTCCASGSACKYSNAYYSQCL